MSTEFGESRNWTLTEAGPEVKKLDPNPRKPNGAIEVGDVIFDFGESQRSFVAKNGDRFIKDGNTIRRLTAEGSCVASYRSPWLLRPFSYAINQGWHPLIAMSSVLVSLVAHKNDATRKREPTGKGS